MPKTDDFEIIEIDVPEPKDGEIQVKNVGMSVDPYMRGRMYDRKSCVPPFQIGEVLTGGCIGQVTALTQTSTRRLCFQQLGLA